MTNATGTERPIVKNAGRAGRSRKLVFGLLDKGLGNSNLVFIQQKDAKRLAKVHYAIKSARTWGAFCTEMPLRDLKRVTDNLLEAVDGLPGKRDRFDSAMLPGSYFDGDWPDWPEQMMLSWMPHVVVQEYGETTATSNGYYLTLNMRDAREILAELERNGFACRLDEQLVRLACGGS